MSRSRLRRDIGSSAPLWPRLAVAVACIGLAVVAGADDVDYFDLNAAQHQSWDRPLNDPFSRLQANLAEGRVVLDRGSEKAFVVSLLGALDIPVASQMLVFSTTSLQLSRISPRNPRALYFNDDIYLGWVPGGKIEIASIDPALGCVFFIFDIPAQDDGRPLQIERSNRCMNCHAGAETRDVPGLTIKSVIPGSRGGSLESFRINETGHTIPLKERFGGWYLTGNHGMKQHRGNAIGELWKGEMSLTPVMPGDKFDWSAYPASTSDILAHLLHEHQAGFVNRVVEATYLARAFSHADGGTLTDAHAKVLDEHADIIVRYLFFADEAVLPPGGIQADQQFSQTFLDQRRPSTSGDSLRDLDLRTRVFKYRCSYMIYSDLFAEMPEVLASRVYQRINAVLEPGNLHPDFDYISAEEKASIRAILNETFDPFVTRQ